MAYAGNSAAFGRGAHCATITGDITLTNQDSGKIFFLGVLGATTITLPSAKAGVHYKFINTGLNTGDVKIDTGTASATAPDIYGVTAGAAGEAISAKRILTIANSPETIGDQIDIISDGTNWYCSNMQGADNAIVGADS